MKLLAHRGQWGHKIAQNSVDSFILAFENGYGIETDLRDHCGDIVISHDMPGGGAILFSEFLALYKETNADGVLALNVKADGLQHLAKRYLQQYEISKSQYFFFDMSIPDALGYRNLDLSYFARLSEYEPSLMLGDDARGIWIDIFEGCWFDEVLIEKYQRMGYQLVLVSPELHKRDHREVWENWRNMINSLDNEIDVNQLMLCTDFPDEAAEFFNVQN